MDCRERNEEREPWKREFATYLEMNERDCRQKRSLRLVAAWVVGGRGRFGFVFSRDWGFRDYLGFFFKSLFIATSDPTKRTPSSWRVKGAIKARLNHASPEKRTPFRCFVLFLTPQSVFAAPRPTNAFKNIARNQVICLLWRPSPPWTHLAHWFNSNLTHFFWFSTKI